MSKETCPRCNEPDCPRWEAEQKMSPTPDWKQRHLDEDCAFMANACPRCKGKCCRDMDYGGRVYHMAAESYEHWCDDCRDGQVPAPDPRDALIDALRAELVAAKDREAHWQQRALDAERAGVARLRSELAAERAKLEKLGKIVSRWPRTGCADECYEAGDCVCGSVSEQVFRSDARKLLGLED